MSSQPCYRMFNKHRTIALFPNFPMTSSGIQLDLSFFPLQFCFKGRRTEEHLAVYLGLRHRHLWREHSRWHRWNLQGEQVVACNEKLRDALSQTLFLPIIPFPPSSRLPWWDVPQWATWCPDPSALVSAHQQQNRTLAAAGEKVRGVMRIKTEGVRERVWDCRQRLVPGLNERRIRVKCSVCVAIKSLE